MALKLRRRTRRFTNGILQHRSSGRPPDSVRTRAASFKRWLGCTGTILGPAPLEPRSQPTARELAVNDATVLGLECGRRCMQQKWPHQYDPAPRNKADLLGDSGAPSRDVDITKFPSTMRPRQNSERPIG